MVKLLGCTTGGRYREQLSDSQLLDTHSVCYFDRPVRKRRANVTSQPGSMTQIRRLEID